MITLPEVFRAVVAGLGVQRMKPAGSSNVTSCCSANTASLKANASVSTTFAATLETLRTAVLGVDAGARAPAGAGVRPFPGVVAAFIALRGIQGWLFAAETGRGVTAMFIAFFFALLPGPGVQLMKPTGTSKSTSCSSANSASFAAKEEGSKSRRPAAPVVVFVAAVTGVGAGARAPGPAGMNPLPGVAPAPAVFVAVPPQRRRGVTAKLMDFLPSVAGAGVQRMKSPGSSNAMSCSCSSSASFAAKSRGATASVASCSLAGVFIADLHFLYAVEAPSMFNSASPRGLTATVMMSFLPVAGAFPGAGVQRIKSAGTSKVISCSSTRSDNLSARVVRAAADLGVAANLLPRARDADFLRPALAGAGVVASFCFISAAAAAVGGAGDSTTCPKPAH